SLQPLPQPASSASSLPAVMIRCYRNDTQPRGELMKTITTALAALMLTACASSGVRVTDEQMSQFKEGQTTQQDVITALGQPTTTMRNADGTTVLMYTYAEARTRGSTFIPIVGAFVGGV